jgi:hypothetical protein
MTKILFRAGLALIVIVLIALWVAFFSPRPPLTTDPATLAGDGSGIIHDHGPNSTAGQNTNDTEGAVLFVIGEREYCPRTSASMIWNEGVLDFHAFGWGPVVVRRYLEGERLVWEYADGSVTKMERICELPEGQRVPKPRGRRFSIFASPEQSA